MTLTLPQLSHHQFEVLRSLEQAPSIGSKLQQRLASKGWKGVPSSFTNLMKPLVSKRLVSATKKTIKTDAGAKTFAFYSLLPEGEQRLREVRSFYTSGTESEVAVDVAGHLSPTIERLLQGLPFMEFDDGESLRNVRRRYEASIESLQACNDSISVLATNVLRAATDNQITVSPFDIAEILVENTQAFLRGLDSPNDEPLPRKTTRGQVLDVMSKNIGRRCLLLKKNLADVLERIRNSGVVGLHVWRNFQLLEFHYGRIVFTEEEIAVPTETDISDSTRTERGLLIDQTTRKTISETTRTFRVVQVLQTHSRQLREPTLESVASSKVARPERIRLLVESLPLWLVDDVSFAIAKDFDELVSEEALSESTHTVTLRKSRESTIERRFSSSTRDAIVRGTAGLASVAGTGLSGLAKTLDAIPSAIHADPAVILAGHWVIAGWHPSEITGGA